MLPEILLHGMDQFVRNANVALHLWQAGDNVIPIVCRTRPATPNDTNICSPWSHYVRYPLEEIRRHGRGISALLARAALYSSIPFLRLARIDDVVSVNNWLIATNPSLSLSPTEIELLTRALCQRFPHRAILIRSIAPATSPDLAAHLQCARYRLIANRTVYTTSPGTLPGRRARNAKTDRKLLHDGLYEIVPHDGFTAADMPRLAELQHALYIEKYSGLNPQYEMRFFTTAWKSHFFEFWGLRRNGRVDAFLAFYENGGVLTGSLLGYDTSLPKALGMYRRVIAIAAEEAARRGLSFQWSAGAGAFKHHRGGKPSVEYDAVYDRHLPVYRRLGWRLLEAAGIFQQRKVARGW